MIKSSLGLKLWIHQDKVDYRVFSPSVPNTNGIDMWMQFLPVVLIVYSFTGLRLKSFFLI